MTSIQLTAHVGKDGTLRLRVPDEFAGLDVDVVVQVKRQAGGWPPGFIEATAGAWQGEPLERPPQGDYEIRETLE